MEDTTIPSDSNGVYSLPSGYEAVTGEVIQASQHNPPLEDLASAMSQRLMRSGVAPMTGPLKIADGSVGSPGIKFSSDGTTGFYKTTNGLGVAVGGTKVAEFTASGVSRMLGELIAWTMLSAPAGWVLAYGQTLSRTTYPDFWTAVQTEIAGGNTFFNNGNGTTTFGIGDLRGRVVAGKDDMGGTSANRLGSGAGFSGTDGKDPAILGAYGGREIHSLTTAQLAVHSHANSISDPGHGHPGSKGRLQGSGSGAGSLNARIGTNETLVQDTQVLTIASGATGISISNANAGSGAAHNNTQPTIITNYILYAGA